MNQPKMVFERVIETIGVEISQTFLSFSKTNSK